MFAKSLAERNYLGRRNKLVKGIVKLFLDIGNTIDTYVQQGNVGANAWQRTGVLTFNDNCKVKEKVPHKRIQEHLQEVYHRYCTVVHLCMARNRRHCSAKCHKAVAQVTCRRARKGFCLHYKPDKHGAVSCIRG